MGEDIKILENIIVEYSTQVEDYKHFSVPVRLDERDIEALENLLKRYKQLEEEYDKLTKHFIDNHIPKTKVKENMKKYEWSLNGYDSSTADYKHSQCIGRYFALLELLGKE